MSTRDPPQGQQGLGLRRQGCTGTDRTISPPAPPPPKPQSSFSKSQYLNGQKGGSFPTVLGLWFSQGAMTLIRGSPRHRAPLLTSEGLQPQPCKNSDTPERTQLGIKEVESALRGS